LLLTNPGRGRAFGICPSRPDIETSTFDSVQLAEKIIRLKTAQGCTDFRPKGVSRKSGNAPIRLRIARKNKRFGALSCCAVQANIFEGMLRVRRNLTSTMTDFLGIDPNRGNFLRTQPPFAPFGSGSFGGAGGPSY